MKYQRITPTSRFRSGLEERIAKQLEDLGVSYDYETLKIRYTKPKEIGRYNPDFILPNGIIIEAKGQFITADRKKHKLIREEFGAKYDIRFVFSNAKAKLYKGAKSRYFEWCEKNDFMYANRVIPEDWLKEKGKNNHPDRIKFIGNKIRRTK